MQIKKTKGITKLMTITVITIGALFLQRMPALAENTYMGPGYQGRLDRVIDGGYSIETFTKINRLHEEIVNKRNVVEEIINSSHQAAPISTNAIAAMDAYLEESSKIHNSEIAQQNKQRENVASANTAFTYIPYSDGSKIYFKNGLPDHKENERVIDEFGNLSIRNTFNMKYNDMRLLTSYDAAITDNLGNTSQISWYGASYTPDSLYYGGKDANANKNMLEYYLKETDSAGNTKTTHWNAVGGYDGKVARSYHQHIEDSIYGIMDFTRTNVQYDGSDSERPTSWHEEGVGQDGLYYSLDKTGVAYNDKSQVTAYHEVKYVTQVDGSKTKATTDFVSKYQHVPNQFGSDVEEPEPDKILESHVTTTIENQDGSHRTEVSLTKYEYENGQLVNAGGHTEINGQESDWWEYKDSTGQILTRSEENEEIVYFYTDTDTLQKVYVPTEQVISTLRDGSIYTGSSETIYEVLEDGRPTVKQTETTLAYYAQDINPSELQRIERNTTTYNNGVVTYTNGQGLTFKNIQALGKVEHIEITYPLQDPNNTHMITTNKSYEYKYDQNGNLQDLILLSGTSAGWEYDSNKGFYGQYTSTIEEDYTVILGRPLMTDSIEDKDYLR